MHNNEITEVICITNIETMVISLSNEITNLNVYNRRNCKAADINFFPITSQEIA